ncbi:hypothetical protein P8Q88_06515 [Qipengyuania sp. XHP0207]|uniref:hypothetical protein n=1 Tax=Qipengyuania sp. XHP0207 TaxID=3038078 RepID=UPI00241C041B|nr:hypothetical protein [Qipengyuania sp. XHP0207]MDG5747828.1 hypothetical protein [Qipengyuania sp. XHP0207]
MKTLLTFALAATASAAALAVPVSAGGEQDIVVRSPTQSLNEWKADMNAQLDRKLIRSDGFRNQGPMTAIVQIRFTLDEEGKPTNLQTLHHSGARRAAYASRFAVRSLRGFDEAPLPDARAAVYQANLIFARNDREKAELKAELDRVDQARIAANGAPDVIMLGG